MEQAAEPAPREKEKSHSKNQLGKNCEAILWEQAAEPAPRIDICSFWDYTSREKLRKKEIPMRHNPRPQEMYRHFKGNLYQIRCLAKHSETREPMVVYQAMYGTFEIFVRPLSMFMEEVDRGKYPDARQRYRFELLQDMEDEESAALSDTVRQKESAALPEISGQKESGAISSEEAEEMQKADCVTESVIAETVPAETAPEEEQLNIDPLVLAFLDADSYEQKLMILDSLHNRITDSMINTMAVASDLEIKEGDLEDRYMELRNCLRTFEKFECNRLR